jgi:nucleoside-diphosphate-sugar epimerase
MGGLEEKKVVVTGATGFVGSNLTAELVNRGAKVSILSRRDVSKSPILKDIRLNAYKCDLLDLSRLKDYLREISPGIVYHLGAVVDLSRSFETAQKCVKANIQGTLNMLNACEDLDLRSFILASTCDVYKSGSIPFREDSEIEPTSPYAISKVASEQLCMFAHENYGIPAVILRLSTVYGPNQKPERLIPYTIISCLKGKGLSFTSGEQTRDLTYVRDIANGIVRASLEKKAVGEIINLGNDKEYKIREIVERIMGIMNCNKKPNFGAIHSRRGEANRWFCDISKAKKILGWKPETDIESGLIKTINWYKKFNCEELGWRKGG